MKQAKISELKDHLSLYLEHVRAGGTVRVFDRKRPVADIVPIRKSSPSGSAELDAITADLERRGVVRRGTGKLPPDFLTCPLPKGRGSVLATLLEDRREGR